MYRIGFTPWDGHQMPVHLRELVESDGALPVGRALDVGCGTGDTSIYLAQHGWDVTGIDFVERALEKARLKGQRATVNIRWLRADVTKLGRYEIGHGFNLVTDNGLIHGLSDDARDAYVQELSPLLADGGRLLILLLALWGEHDLNVDPEVNRSIFEVALDAAGNGDHTLVIVPSADHELERATSPRHAIDDAPFADDVWRRMTAWVSDRFGPDANRAETRAPVEAGTLRNPPARRSP